MKADLRVIVFAVVLGAVCSLLLAGASQLFRPYREANEKAEKVRNFLSSLEVPLEGVSGTEALLDVFDRNVKTTETDTMVLYEYIPESSAEAGPVAYAVQFSGSGLWGPVHGVMALEPDLKTIRGIRFFKHEETPGLGGEIGARWFQDQFKGKLIISDSGEPGFEITKPGKARTKNQVDGITGASMTSNRIETIIDSLAKDLAKERSSNVER